MRNIFLTGKKNIGKSTIIHSVVQMLKTEGFKIAGFETLAYVKDDNIIGYYLEPLDYEEQISDISRRMIGRCIGNGDGIGITETFEGFGVNILDYCLESSADIVVLDELGFFESNAVQFQRKVHELLSSEKVVLGIIKPKPIPFMDSIREREDVIVYEITQINREYMTQNIYELLNFHIRRIAYDSNVNTEKYMKETSFRQEF